MIQGAKSASIRRNRKFYNKNSKVSMFDNTHFGDIAYD